MRYLLVLLGVIGLLIAKEPIQKEEGVIDNVVVGGGIYTQSQPYGDAKALVTPTPVIFFDNSLFYVRWVRFGMYFAGAKKENYSWGLSLSVQPRPFGYESSDAKILQGMNERDTSWEGGVALAFKADDTFVEFLVFRDLLGKSEGTIARAELGGTYEMGDWSFYPSVLAIWHDEKFNNYYYGVKQEEEIAGVRAAYNAKAGFDYAAQTYVKYAFNPQWHALFNFRADYLNTQIRNSPIVSDKTMVSGMLSLMYSFNF